MPINLIHDNPSLAEVTAILKQHPRIPLLPSYGSKAWKLARENPLVLDLVKPLREKAITESSEPLPVLTDDLYASFRRTGRRLEFERVYFDRRKRLARAVASLLLSGPEDPQLNLFIKSTLEKFTAIFDEVSWALPAHVNWHNDDVTGKEPMQIDLFCAETANLMAEVLDLLGQLVPPTLRDRVRARLQSHVFDNYLNRFDEFHWPKVTHNWNAVCHQGVIGSALSQLEDPDKLARMLLLARESLPLFLNGFAKDGGCTEGIGYWSYGFGWFIVLNEQLETRTGGELSLVEGDEHIRKIARFGPRMALAGGNLVNFSDNKAEGQLGPALLTYLSYRLNEPDCTQEAQKSYRHLIQTGVDAGGQRTDVFYLGRLMLNCPEKLPDPKMQSAVDCFLPDLAVLVAHGTDSRGHLWDFAAKAGHNDEHHNHNDCGGFLLNIDGTRLVAEIGAPEYVKDFFSPKRYEFLAARSLGHSVPVINGCEQAAGASFTSRVLSHSLTAERVEFVVDATASYPPEAGCLRFIRSFQFDKLAGRLRVHDIFELSKTESLEGAIISLLPIVLTEGKAILRNDKLELVLRATDGSFFDRVEKHPYQNHSGQEAFAFRLVWKSQSLMPKTSLAIEMELT